MNGYWGGRVHFDGYILSLEISLGLVLPAVKLHLYSAAGSVSQARPLTQIKMTNSCLRFPMSSFILTSNRSTSRRRAAVAARIAAESFFVLMVISPRSSDNAARNRYACCHCVYRRNTPLLQSTRTLSKSLTVKPSLRTLPMRSTSNARVALMRLLAVGSGNVLSRAVKNVWV